MATPNVRKLEKFVALSEDEFRRRFMQRFYDPMFDSVRDELDRVCEKAWDGYIAYRKSPRTRPASSSAARRAGDEGPSARPEAASASPSAGKQPQERRPTKRVGTGISSGEEAAPFRTATSLSTARAPASASG